MKIRVKLPELAHLAPEQRETIIRRCLRSDELRDYRSRALRRLILGGVLFTLLLIVCLFFAGEHGPWLSALVVGLYLLYAVGGTVLKVRGEIRLVHRLVQRELEAFSQPRPS